MASYFEYLHDHLCNPVCKISWQYIDVATPHCFTKPVTKPYCRSTVCLLEFCTTVNLYGFKRSNVVAACTHDFDTPDRCDNRVTDFRADASNRALISSDVSFERTRSNGSTFFFNKVPVVRNLSAHYLFRKNWNAGKPTSKFAATLSVVFLPYTDFHNKTPYYAALHINEHKQQSVTTYKVSVSHCTYIHEPQITLPHVTPCICDRGMSAVMLPAITMPRAWVPLLNGFTVQYA